MVDPKFLPPINPHFFQPLLPGFQNNLNIPVKFFMKHIEGQNENSTAKLRSDVSYRTWEVKMDGRRFTDGWKDFAADNDFRVGDFIVFRHEGGMDFHVTGFGPSCCNLQYDIMGNPSGENGVKNNSRTGEESSSSHSYFMAPVTASNLRADTLSLPTRFADSNGLFNRCGKIVLMNEHGRSWTLNLRHRKSRHSAYIRGGWSSFCNANGHTAGGFVTFKLVRNGTTPFLQLSTADFSPQMKHSGAKELNMKPTSPSSRDRIRSEECSTRRQSGGATGACSSSLRICSEESGEKHGHEKRSGGCEDERIEKKKKKKKKTRSVWRVSSSPTQNRFVTLTLTPLSIKTCKLRLPTNFTKVNGIEEAGEIVLMDRDGGERQINLLKCSDRGKMRFGKGWKDFCRANDVRTGESFVLKLVSSEEDATPVLKFCSKIRAE